MVENNFGYAKLRGKIVEKYGSQYKFAEALKISENSLSKKLTGKTQFRQGDIQTWCRLLDIPVEKAGLYFFK